MDGVGAGPAQRRPAALQSASPRDRRPDAEDGVADAESPGARWPRIEESDADGADQRRIFDHAARADVGGFGRSLAAMGAGAYRRGDQGAETLRWDKPVRRAPMARGDQSRGKFMIDRFDHIVLTVRSLEATLGFYERALGFVREIRPGVPAALIFG